MYVAFIFVIGILKSKAKTTVHLLDEVRALNSLHKLMVLDIA
jgi:hypothetical protein